MVVLPINTVFIFVRLFLSTTIRDTLTWFFYTKIHAAQRSRIPAIHKNLVVYQASFMWCVPFRGHRNKSLCFINIEKAKWASIYDKDTYGICDRQGLSRA